MREVICDVAVIGAGTAGIAAQRAASRAGAHAILIEAGPGGTTCARVGCMPSKLLIAAATAASDARGAGLFGIRTGEVGIDGPAVLARVRSERDRFVAGVFAGLDELPADLRLAGRARFTGPDTLTIDDHTRVRFRAAVVASGSSPAIPAPLRNLGERVLTTDTLFEIADLPATLAVLGGGPVGIEMAQAMARLGVRVCLLDSGRSLAALTDPDLAPMATAIFGDEITLHLGAKVERAEATGDGVRLGWTDANGSHSGTFDRVLAAVGRRPNVSDLGLEAAGLNLDDEGGPRFDPRSLLCEGGPIFIAGDANAERPVVHEAARQGDIAGHNAAAFAASGSIRGFDPPVRLAMVFTHPGTATVGEAYDPDRSSDRLVGSVDFSDQGRARILGRNSGGIRVYADRSGRLTGAEVIGPEAEHLAHILAFAIQDGQTAESLHGKPFYHPTLEEGLKTALADIMERQRRAGTPAPASGSRAQARAARFQRLPQYQRGQSEDDVGDALDQRQSQRRAGIDAE